MKKTLYYIRTNGYDLIASVPENPDWPTMYSDYIADYEYADIIISAEPEDRPALALEYLKKIEDDSSWDEDEDGIVQELLEICDDYRITGHPELLATLEVDYL